MNQWVCERLPETGWEKGFADDNKTTECRQPYPSHATLFRNTKMIHIAKLLNSTRQGHKKTLQCMSHIVILSKWCKSSNPWKQTDTQWTWLTFSSLLVSICVPLHKQFSYKALKWLISGFILEVFQPHPLSKDLEWVYDNPFYRSHHSRRKITNNFK